jgi:hypothetical protein
MAAVLSVLELSVLELPANTGKHNSKQPRFQHTDLDYIGQEKKKKPRGCGALRT